MHAPVSRAFGAYTLSDDPARLDLAAMHAFLRQAYWSQGIPREVLERAVQGSLCLGAYDAAGAQVGLARFVSDFATFCYVCDVYVLAEHRGRGIARALLGLALAHPRLQGRCRARAGPARHRPQHHALHARFIYGTVGSREILPQRRACLTSSERTVAPHHLVRALRRSR